jgi:fatty-acyl-CoA synthase
VSIARTPDTPEASLGPLTDDLAILDTETGEPCQPGVIGELVNISGAGQFRGYYKDPHAEAQRMIKGAYHSGDLAYCDEAGFVYFAGRLGDWMRVDGENLGTAPIERVLMRYPDVVEAAVYGIPDPAVGDRVMVALVLADGVEFDIGRVAQNEGDRAAETLGIIASHCSIVRFRADTAHQPVFCPRRNRPIDARDVVTLALMTHAPA